VNAQVMAAYRRGMTYKVTCGLTACTPGSALGPTLGNEYGRTLPDTFTVKTRYRITGNIVLAKQRPNYRSARVSRGLNPTIDLL